ncbi:OmpA family protein [Zhouia sp. PK063]|uniref:OmpA family protein n=1 Tax=Zhouia sp. PK063 TaxID=3373602 RepID=UPI00379757CF
MKNFLISLIIFCCISIPVTWYIYQPVTPLASIEKKDVLKDSNTGSSTKAINKKKDSVIQNTIKPNIVLHKTLYASFASNEYKPQDSLKILAKAWLTYLQQHPSKKIIVTGHTDDIGEAVDNKWIGLQRAKSVAKFLEHQGFDENKIEVNSMGEEQPLVPNISLENRRKNRRIEINIQ